MIRKATIKDTEIILNLLRQISKYHSNLRPDIFKVSSKYNYDEVAKTVKKYEAENLLVAEEGTLGKLSRKLGLE